MNAKTLTLSCITLLCCFGAGTVFSYWLSARNSTPPPVAKESEVEMVTVLVAKKTISMADFIVDPDDWAEFKQFVKGEEPQFALTSKDQLAYALLKKMVRTGAVITEGDLFSKADNIGGFGFSADGLVGMGIEVYPEKGPLSRGWWSLDGSRVDILNTIRTQEMESTHVVVEDVLIVSTEKLPEENPDGSYTPAIFSVAVHLKDVARIQVAASLGKLSLMLRRQDDNVDGLDTPVGPGSTVGGCLLVNCLKVEIADRLTRVDQPPKVLSAAALVGAHRATELFESAYDEHAHRLAKLYAEVGRKASTQISE